MKKFLLSVLILSIVFSFYGCSTISTLFSNAGKPGFSISVPHMEVYAEYEDWCGLKGTIEITCTDKSKDYLVLLSYALPSKKSPALCYIHDGIGQMAYTFIADDKSGGSVGIEGYAVVRPANSVKVGEYTYHKVDEWMEPYNVFKGEAPIEIPDGGDWLVSFKQTSITGSAEHLTGFKMDHTTAVYNGKGMIYTQVTNKSGETPVDEIGEINGIPLQKIDAKLLSYGKWLTEENNYDSLNSTSFSSSINIKPEFTDSKLVCFLVTLLSGGENPVGTTFTRMAIFTDGEPRRTAVVDEGEYKKINKPEYEITSFGAISFKELDSSAEGLTFSWDESFYS